MTTPRLLEVTYARSAIGRPVKQRRTIAALGLHRLHQSVRHADTPTMRGMIHIVQHLVTYHEVEEGQQG